MKLFLILLIGVSVALLIALAHRYRTLRREAFIRSAELPKGLFDKLKKRHPHLSTKDCHLVANGLRQFFLVYLKSGRRFVSMPSQVVDDLWHEFILYTKGYDSFCRRAFGRFLHHTPAVVLGKHQQGNAGLRRCWWYACKEENIHPRTPSRLPLLFALDAKLAITEGFRYVPDCGSVRRDAPTGGAASPHCGADFGSTAFDGGTDGFGDGGNDGGDSSGHSGSDGGGDSGCGGGGCGGGD